jgi:predicted nucleotidyltransferase
MDVNGVHFDEQKLAEFCRRHGVLRLALFGSILSDDFRPDSDVDFLVEFQPNERVSLFDIGGMIVELTELVGRQVDLRTPRDLSKYFREDVVRVARPLYAA